jgi:lipooligosaccharide transport system permease protein
VRWSRKLARAPELEPPDEPDGGIDHALIDDEPTNGGVQDEPIARDASSAELLRAAEQAAGQVALVLRSADEAAEHRLEEAREEAEEIHRRAEFDAERVRAEADAYVANVRLAADSYATQRQAEAEELSRKTLAEAAAEAGRIKDGELVLVESPEEEKVPPAGAPRVRRGIEFTAVVAVMSRDVSVFLRSWRSTTFSAIVEPIIFLLAFGLGFGALVSQVNGVDYIQFVATGVVATTVVFSSAFPGMFSTFVKREFQRIYDALLATPVNVNELVTAEVLWISTRTGVYSIAPVLVAIGFGLRPAWTVVFVPFIAFLTAIGLSSFGVTMAAMMKSIANFNYIISGVLTPLILLAGAYFPVEDLPRWAFIANQFNPLYHCVTLVRDAAFGIDNGNDLYHLAVLVGFGVVMWRIAISRLRPRLID